MKRYVNAGLLFVILCFSISATAARPKQIGRCAAAAIPRDSSEFWVRMKDSYKTRALFERLTKKDRTLLIDDHSLQPRLAIIPNGTMVMTLRYLGREQAQIIYGQMEGATRDTVTIRTHGQLRTLKQSPLYSDTPGVDQLAVFDPTKTSVEDGFVRDFNNITEAERTFSRLTQKATVIDVGNRRTLFLLIPVGSLVVVNRTVSGVHFDEVIRGHVASVDDSMIKIRVGEDILELWTYSGIGGITSIAVIPE